MTPPSLPVHYKVMFMIQLVQMFMLIDRAVPPHSEVLKFEQLCLHYACSWEEYIDETTLFERLRVYLVHTYYKVYSKTETKAYALGFFHQFEGFRDILKDGTSLDAHMRSFMLGYAHGFHGTTLQGEMLFRSLLS